MNKGPSEGLSCVLPSPLVWYPIHLSVAARVAVMQQACYLLTALNQIESPSEPALSSPDNRRLDRIEAKLDLTLHLLSRLLQPLEPASSVKNAGESVGEHSWENAVEGAEKLRLSPHGIEWFDPAPPLEGTELMVELRPAEVLSLTLKLPAIALPPKPGDRWSASARFEGVSETLAEALYQFIFRKHRQAIRVAMSGASA
jgi:hypothetical protein